MTRAEIIALAGLGATLYALWKSGNMTTKTPAVATPKRTRKWAGSGTDPFDTSYTVTGRAIRGGL
jgi:hypothetical protein